MHFSFYKTFGSKWEIDVRTVGRRWLELFQHDEAVPECIIILLNTVDNKIYKAFHGYFGDISDEEEVLFDSECFTTLIVSKKVLPTTKF